MRENYRKSIASIEKLPRFTTMNVIDGQAGLVIYASLIFYSLTIDNILNIIVLLILAGVSISMISSQDGILGKATGAKESQRDATELERVKLAVQSALIDGEGTIELAKATDSTKAVGLEKALKEEFKNDSEEPKYEEGKVTLTNGDIYNVTPSGSVEKAITLKKQGDLKIGSEVTASNGESFYVIGGDTVGTEISDATQNVILLAKYNLKKEGTEITLKQDTTGENNECRFSSTDYWSKVSGIAYPDVNGKYPDLNDEKKYPIPEGVKSIITTAKAYGKTFGVTGRLMSMEDVVKLGVDSEGGDITDNCPSFLKGYGTGVLYYWLGSASYQGGNIWFVDGETDFVCGDVYNSTGIGVRPVIEVLKSSIK